jgi:DNA-binding transcriptional LysR family regulator
VCEAKHRHWIGIEIDFAQEIIERLLSHELLLGVVGARAQDERLEFVPFTEDELTVIASPGLVADKSVTLEALLRHPFVMREEGSGTRRDRIASKRDSSSRRAGQHR